MHTNRIIIVVLLTISLLLHLSCSRDEITKPQGSDAAVQLILPKGATAEQIDQIVLRVIGAEDFIYFDTTEVFGLAFAFPTFEIPAGPAEFTVDALQDLEVVYTGVKEVDIVSGVNNVVVINVESPDVYYPVSGLVSDAETGLPIAGAEVLLDDESRLTNDLGFYIFESVSLGSHSMSAGKADYIQNDKIIQVGNAPLNVNFTLTRQLAGDQWRFVLTWGAEPVDLDLHLYSGMYHIFYFNTGSEDSEPFIMLDTDDTDGYGPETITVVQLRQSCQIAVNNYLGEADIKVSMAHVEVYNGSTRVKTYSVPVSGSGRWWYVCELSASGSLIDQDYLSDSEPSLGKLSPAPKKVTN